MLDLSKYQELTGLNVSSSKAGIVQAQINRTTSLLETMLGFSLNPEFAATNLYNELGKSTDSCACPNVAINEENLDSPDVVQGAYRLFPYNSLDQFLHIDPFKRIYKVKLVYVKQGATDNGVTLKTFDIDQVRSQIGRDGIGKYLEICRNCWCECGCDGCVQLAVDADWLWTTPEEVPNDLLYVLCDMVQYYSNPKRDIKSESITTHSYTKFDNTPPQALPDNLAIIKHYAGPNGTATVMPTTGASARRGSGIWV